jgi:lysophospholipase L1-like esterase
MFAPIRTISLAAAVLCALVTLPGSAMASPASRGNAVIRPDDPRLRFMGHWGHTADAAITVNSGSELTFRFTGHRLTGLFDTSTITVPSQIYVSLDGGTRTLYKVDHDEIDFTPTGLSGGAHTATIEVKDVDEYENRWILPLQSGVVLKGFRLEPRARVLPTRPPYGHRRMEFYGDSITEGVAALCNELGVNCADGTVDYANLTGKAFHADFNQVGFGKQGIIQPGHGGVGTASQSFGWNFAGSPADPHFRPDVVVVNQGTNDTPYSSADFQPGYLAYLRQIRAAYPHAWIFAMRPFGGSHADDIAWAVGEMDDPRIVYVDTTGWLSAADGDFNGGHPSVQGHRKAADRLVPLIAATTGWRV